MRMRRMGVVLLYLALLATVVLQTPSASAASGTITIDPGQTKYVSFGSAASGDVLLWYLSISTWSTVFTYWLEAPNGQHLTISSTHSGYTATLAGEWRIGFSIDASGFWSAEVYYDVYRMTPYIEILDPLDSTYVNEAEVLVMGTVDGFANEVSVSLDAVHFEDADLYLVIWNKQVTLPAEGENTIIAQAKMTWGSYTTVYFDSVTLTLDVVQPEVGIVGPANNSFVAGSADLSWQCSDECGIALKEVKVDLLDWVTVVGNEYGCTLSDGSHTVKVRVTDVAGNSAVTSVTIVSDTVVPNVALVTPNMNSKISKDSVTISWTGSDALAGIDRYEVRISGGDWTDVGLDTSYTFTGLEDKWYTVTVRAVDKSGNSADSSVGFGIYTSIWSTNGPYSGIPLYALIAGIIVAALLAYVAVQRRFKQAGPPHEKRP